jgi:hypothetical protein
MDINYQKEMYWHLDNIQNKAILNKLETPFRDSNQVDTFIVLAENFKQALNQVRENDETPSRLRP